MPVILSSNPDAQPMSAKTDVITVVVAPPVVPHPLQQQPDPVTTTLAALLGLGSSDVTAPTVLFYMNPS